MDTYGDKLRYLRERAELTQDDIINQLRQKDPTVYLTRDQYANWENCRNLPRLEAMLLLKRYYNTTLDDLFDPKVSIKQMAENIQTKLRKRDDLS